MQTCCEVVVSQELQSKGFKCRSRREFENQVDKVVQLHETMETRHSTMVVGTTGGGKTVIIETLAAAHKAAFDEVVKILPINPKAQGTDELYGVLGRVYRNEVGTNIISKQNCDPLI